MLLSFPVKIKIDSIEIMLQIASTRPDNEILETDTPLPTDCFCLINWLIERAICGAKAARTTWSFMM